MGPEPSNISTRVLDGGTQNMLIKFFNDFKLGGIGGSVDNWIKIETIW